MWSKVFLFGVLCALTVPAAATNFSVLLSGGGSSSDVSKNIREIAIDELNIDVVDKVAQRDGWRLYGPGLAHWGNARITIEPGADSEFFTWYQEAAKGKNIRKNISVTLIKSDKKPGRKFNLIDCFPMSWSVGQPDPTGQLGADVLTVKIGEVELTSEESRGPGNGPVAILNAAGRQVDSYDSWGGGEPNIILTPLFSGENFHTNSPGHKTINEITLRGAISSGRKGMYDWISNTLDGKRWKQMVTLTELLSVDGSAKKGRTYNYFDCFPIRYVFPRISVDGPPAEQLMEEVTVKPIRVELK